MSTGSENGSVDGMQQVRKAAAALADGVGSFADPRDMQARLLHSLGWLRLFDKFFQITT